MNVFRLTRHGRSAARTVRARAKRRTASGASHAFMRFDWSTLGTLLAPIYAAIIAGVVYFGLPLAIVLMIVLVIRLSVRRRRENRAS